VKLRLRVSHVRLGSTEFRVMQPAAPTPRAVLYDRDRWLSMYVDRQASMVLTALWGLASRSPRSLIYLPMRANSAPEGVGEVGQLPSLDLVLLHHHLQLLPSRWKLVRARLGVGRLHTASVRDADFPDESAVDYERWRFREFRDYLGFHLAANTLFIVGSGTAFREHGARIRGLPDDAPSYLIRYPRADHYCVELSAGPWARPRVRGRVPGHLHVQYCGEWRT
jgi:hypothetical protein